MKVNVGSKSINASLSTLTLLEFVRISNVLTKKTTDVLAWRDLFVSMGADVQEIEEMDVQDFALIVKEFIKNFSEKTKSEVFTTLSFDGVDYEVELKDTEPIDIKVNLLKQTLMEKLMQGENAPIMAIGIFFEDEKSKEALAKIKAVTEVQRNAKVKLAISQAKKRAELFKNKPAHLFVGFMGKLLEQLNRKTESILQENEQTEVDK